MTAHESGITVVVALISGQTADLERCLAALRAQRDAPSIDVLVPYDEPCRDVLRLGAAFPEVRFLPLTGVDTRRGRAGGSHEHHHLLRTLGIAAATGETVALTEDHAHVAPQWCASLLAALQSHPRAAGVGGAIEWDGDTLLSYAVYLCDFGRYQNPLPEQASPFVSDTNVAYRRHVLEEIRAAWAEQYSEIVAHEALAHRGYELWLTPDAVSWQRRRGMRWRSALRERVVWGRSYGSARLRHAGTMRRYAYAAGTLGLPFLLTWRIVAGVWRRRRRVGLTVRAVPALLILTAAWSLGESLGYLTRRAG